MGKIPMLVASVKQSDQRRFAFDVTTPNRVYRFQAENRESKLKSYFSSLFSQAYQYFSFRGGDVGLG